MGPRGQDSYVAEPERKLERRPAVVPVQGQLGPQGILGNAWTPRLSFVETRGVGVVLPASREQKPNTLQCTGRPPRQRTVSPNSPRHGDREGLHRSPDVPTSGRRPRHVFWCPGNALSQCGWDAHRHW